MAMPMPLDRRDESAFATRPPTRVDPRLARRRWSVGFGKRLLPVAALALLASIAFYPELQRQSERAQEALRAGLRVLASGQMTKPVYHGVDERGRPYTLTADSARQVSQERIDVTQPKGDVTLESGDWMQLQSRQGVYMQHLNSLDLSDHVWVYRADGTTLATDTATVDLKAGVATSADKVHAEGPFGTLDAQGFTITDRGDAVQFHGPGRLVLNTARSPVPAGAAQR
jgi:lipopolysaccharide export system protein LptC